MLSESLPPSMPTPSSTITSRSASAQSYMAAPSPGSLAAHIQLPSHLTSASAVTLAHTRLVSASATDMRALAAGDSRPLMGCSPMAVAPPVTGCPSGVSMVWAMTAQSASGVCSGPTHCWRAMSPVTLRSTLLVRNRLDPTVTDDSTLSSASAMAALPVRASSAWNTGAGSAAGTRSAWLEWNVFLGMSPSTLSSGRSTGVVLSWRSNTTHLPSPVTSPTQHMPDRSRALIFSSSGRSSALTRQQLFSWYSAPQSSRTDMVGSPTTTSRISMRQPTGSAISLSTLQLPPAPWSCIDTMGLRSPMSTHARTTRFIFCSISASPRCTALKSRSARFSPKAIDDAAPPPMPMRYAGPPSFTIFMPFSGLLFLRWRASIWPKPPVKRMGLIHSRRSPPKVRSPKLRVKPQMSGSPNLLP
mmetsp:Transcript_80009/g.214132  ORF Transcript_80009/g.214132 Transcript_80009/m.214132 type:complete len:415 (-) Transcript_80009:1264-2508(-)